MDGGVATCTPHVRIDCLTQMDARNQKATRRRVWFKRRSIQPRKRRIIVGLWRRIILAEGRRWSGSVRWLVSAVTGLLAGVLCPTHTNREHEEHRCPDVLPFFHRMYLTGQQ